MDEKIAIALKKAANFIRSGESKQAQRLLVAVLKEEPKLEQAWYMLSFVVEQERVEFVLNQVLTINPDNENAKKRLAKFQQAQQEIVEEPEEEVEEEAIDEEPDMVSSRLENYGVEPDEEPISRPRPEPPEIAPENFMDGEEFTERKRRSPILLILFLLIIIVGAGWGVYNFTDIFKPVTPVSEGIPTATVTEVVPLEPTATLISSIPSETPVPTATATPLPTRTPTPVPSPTKVVFITPAIAMLDILTGLDTEVLEIRDFDKPVDIEKLVLSQYEAVTYFNGIINNPELQDELDKTEVVLTALNLIPDNYSLETTYYNRLGLFSSVYDTNSKTITTFGIPFGIKQAHSYVFSAFAAQLSEMIYENTGLYPGECDWLDQQCQAVTALVWGDAYLSTDIWVNSADLTEMERETISQIDPRETLLLDLNTPHSILIDNQFAIDRGRIFAQNQYNITNWWTELDYTYDNPPTTSEQILHPNKYFLGEEAVEISDPPLTDALAFEWEEIWNSSLGEWYTYLFLRYSEGVDYGLQEVELDDIFDEASEGWGGDQMQIYQNPAGRIVIVGHWIMDTAFDTEEFLDAMNIYNNSRFKDDPPNLDQLGGTCWKQDLYVSCVFTAGQEILWVYTPGEEIMADVWEIFEDFK